VDRGIFFNSYVFEKKNTKKQTKYKTLFARKVENYYSVLLISDMMKFKKKQLFLKMKEMWNRKSGRNQAFTYMANYNGVVTFLLISNNDPFSPVLT
jgi:hypothetical protein